MALDVRPTDATLGAIVTGVRLADLDDAGWEAIESAFHTHAVLIFPDQHLSRAEQRAFGERFGRLDALVAETGTVPISNRLPGGRLRRADDPIMQILLGNEGWHTDSSYMPVSAKASVLSAEIVPREGGETEWADMRAAYDALDEDTRKRIAPLSAFHSIEYSQSRAGHTDRPGAFTYGFEGDDPPLRPLVKHHPVTGRPALFIGRHAYGIPGLDADASERLLDELLELACRPPRVLRHAWAPGDVAVWDNRCVLHRARPYDLEEVRVLHHTRIAGEPATESGIASDR
jgi:alpha-ketoglutarate-dependent taurine dioxygenase